MEVNIQTLTDFKPVGQYKNKKQILLTHTSRNIRDYVMGLKHRYNGNYKKLPHYIISREGVINQLLPDNSYSDYMKVKSYNKSTIIISLENLGWLRKNPLQGGYINWIGNIYKDRIYERKWRGYFFWQPYTEDQLDSLSKLIKKLTNDFNIPETFIGHNVKVEKIEKFQGIATYSNYETDRTDLNPSFNFEKFIKKIKK
jgi:N-acetyl-anhydromuramyl-L-alanine amidase AmpD